MRLSFAFLALLFVFVAAFSYASEIDVSETMEVDVYENDDFPSAMVEVDAEAEDALALDVEDNMALDLDTEMEMEMEADMSRRRRHARRHHKRPARRHHKRPARRHHKRPARRHHKRHARRHHKRKHSKGGLRKLARKLKRGARKISRKVKRGARRVRKGARKLKRKARRAVRKVSRKAKRAARKAKRALKRGVKKAKGLPRKLAKKAKRALKRGGRKAKNALKKILRKGKKIAKKVAKKGKKVLKKGKRIAKKVARKLLGKKKGGKRGKRASRRKFAPKTKAFAGNKQAKLRKSLSKVVDAEPEAAVVKVGKHWGFEDTVVKRLNKYVKMDLNELKEKEQHISKETTDVCALVDKHCGSTNPTAMSNTRTCVLTKDACFQYKISLEKVRRAQKQCNIAKKLKLRTDFIGKMDYSVELAKCKAYVKSVDYYLKQGSNKHASARTAEILDEDATKARERVAGASEELKKLKDEMNKFAPAFKKCQEWVKKAKTCDDASNFGSADCAAARTQSSKCESAGDLEYYTEAKQKYDAAKEQMVNLKAERDSAENVALSGGKK